MQRMTRGRKVHPRWQGQRSRGWSGLTFRGLLYMTCRGLFVKSVKMVPERYQFAVGVLRAEADNF